MKPRVPTNTHSSHIHSNLARRLNFVRNEIEDILQQADDDHLKEILSIIEIYRADLREQCISRYGQDKADNIYHD